MADITAKQNRVKIYYTNQLDIVLQVLSCTLVGFVAAWLHNVPFILLFCVGQIVRSTESACY